MNSDPNGVTIDGRAPTLARRRWHHIAVTAIATAFAAWLGITQSAPASDDGCLFLNANDSPRKEDCTTDPLGLTTQAAIQKAVRGLSLKSVPISFMGCKVVSFMTTLGPSAKSRTYVIYYPLLANRPIDDYVAPITHELSHVFQMELAGGMAKLKATLPSKRRELGADFLAGVIFSHVSDQTNISFQNNLNLVGAYRELDPQAHGTPAQRAAAFRNGAYLDLGAYDNSMIKANTEFQENLYGAVEQM